MYDFVANLLTGRFGPFTLFIGAVAVIVIYHHIVDIFEE